MVGTVPEDDIYANASGDGYVRHNTNYVYLWRAPWTTDAELEYYLVHELTHLAQHEANASDRIGRGVPGANEAFVTDATLEGTAEFAGMRYAEEYGLAYDPYEALVEEYDGAGPFRRLELAPYRYGARYVRHRVDSPRNLTSVYDDPPRSAEQIVHGYAPDEETPKSLSVSGASTNSSWTWADSDVQGELFLRIALGAELDDEQAARAAEGWGADRLLTFERENRTGFAWVLRWDDADEADEFRAAFERYRESRTDESDAAFRTVDLSDATVVVFAGDPAFVGNASASGETGDVTIAP